MYGLISLSILSSTLIRPTKIWYRYFRTFCLVKCEFTRRHDCFGWYFYSHRKQNDNAYFVFIKYFFLFPWYKLSCGSAIDMMYTLIIVDLLNYTTVASQYLVNTSEEKIYKNIFDNKQGLTYLIQQSRCLQL